MKNTSALALTSSSYITSLPAVAVYLISLRWIFAECIVTESLSSGLSFRSSFSLSAASLSLAAASAAASAHAGLAMTRHTRRVNNLRRRFMGDVFQELEHIWRNVHTNREARKLPTFV